MAPVLRSLILGLIGSATLAAAQSCTLDEGIKDIGKQYFGVAVDKNTLTISQNNAIALTEFGSVTPENSMKWDSTEPSQGNFNFANADYLVDWATTNGKKIRGHTLVWHSQLPSWVSAIQDAATLRSVMTNHITTLMTRYKGKIDHWDVVNEIFNDDGTFRQSVFYNVLGEDYVALAFKTAAAVDPNAKLYINDYNIDYSGNKLNAMVALVTKLKAQGVPIHGIGTQAHLISGNGAIPYFSQTLQKIVSANVDVAITELDIRMTLPVSEGKLQQQKSDYNTIIKACRDVARCVGVTVWGISDKYSWVPNTFPGQGAALLWDENFAQKPAYQGVADALL